MESIHLLNDTYFWLTISFAIFVIICVTKGGKAISAILDEKIETIKSDLTSAENLRIEAQELLAQYKRKHKDAQKEAEQIIEYGREHAEKIVKNADRELDVMLGLREKQLEERVAYLQSSAKAELQAYATDLVLQVSHQLIEKHMDKKAEDALLKDAIKGVASSEIH